MPIIVRSCDALRTGQSNSRRIIRLSGTVMRTEIKSASSPSVSIGILIRSERGLTTGGISALGIRIRLFSVVGESSVMLRQV